MKKALLIIGGIIVLIIIIAIASGGGEKERTEQVASRCLVVPEETLSWIESGLIADDLSLESAQAVRSNDFAEVYFVSAYLKGEGLSGDSIATFATNNLDSSGLVLAVNEYAKEFSDWFHGDREGAQYYVTMNHDGARESRECVSQ